MTTSNVARSRMGSVGPGNRMELGRWNCLADQCARFERNGLFFRPK